MDWGHTVEIGPQRHLHLDHGYVVTSHSSQGQTADRVLIHVDTELAAKDFLNSRMAYVANFWFVILRGTQLPQYL
jgi:ATP-dependent exoDNAse (exonuclease V) alpha subunit